MSSCHQALIPLFTEEEEGVLLAVWSAVGAATAAVPKELGPAYVRTLKEAVSTAVERQRRRRLPGPLLLPGLCLPKALSPLLPIYLQGVLQVGWIPHPCVCASALICRHAADYSSCPASLVQARTCLHAHPCTSQFPVASPATSIHTF